MKRTFLRDARASRSFSRRIAAESAPYVHRETSQVRFAGVFAGGLKVR
ncbi:MAG: hypothetical protein HUU20_22615 [Pirellulales bacterium]|nr:hypothetical protein [Pirellulales bacterium]